MADEKTFEQKPRAIKPMRGHHAMPVPKGMIKKGTAGRLLKTAFKYYKWQLIVVAVCILISSTGSLISSLFMKTLLDEVIPKGVNFGFEAAMWDLLTLILVMGAMYGLVVLATFLYNRLMATVIACVRKCLKKCKPCPLSILIRMPTARL